MKFTITKIDCEFDGSEAAGVLSQFGRTNLTALPGCGSNTCDHISDWLDLHFGISLSR